MYRPWNVVVLGVALALAASGCSGDGESNQPGPTSSATSLTPSSPTSSPTSSAATAAVITAADLDGTSYVSTAVTGHDLVAGTTIDLGFDGGTLSVSAGCNTMFGEYVVEDGSLRWSDHPASTMKGCADELMAQDQWLAQLFTDGVAVTSQGSDLTVTSGEVTIELSPKTATTDLTSLLGRTWTVVGTIAGGSTQRTPRRNRLPRLEVGRNGLSRLDTGCNTGRTIVRVDGDAFVFGPTTTTRQHCPQPDREIQRRVLAVLDGRTDTVKNNGTALVITKGEGGLLIQVR